MGRLLLAFFTRALTVTRLLLTPLPYQRANLFVDVANASGVPGPNSAHAFNRYVCGFFYGGFFYLFCYAACLLNICSILTQ